VKRKALFPLLGVAGFIGLGGLPCHWQPAARAAAEPGAQEVHVTLGEWSLSPVHFTVSAGVPVHFVATNNGVLAHALAIEGDAFYAETDAIGSHQSASLDVTILPGLYDLFCPVAAGQHRALGQDGTFEAIEGDEAAEVAPSDPVDLTLAAGEPAPDVPALPDDSTPPVI
jgi:hypothetical protein